MVNPKQFGNVLQTQWDWRAAGNFMFGGTGSGLMLMVALVWFLASPPPALGLLSLVFVGLGLTLVWLEIGRPWRFLNVYFHPQASWMTREGIVASVLFVLALIGIVLSQPVVILLAGLTAAAFLYCQAQILKASKGIPSWREPAVVPLIIVTGLCEGTGIVYGLSSALSVLPQWLSYVFLLLLAGRVYFWLAYRARLKDSAPDRTNQLLRGINQMQLVVGNFIPIVLIAGSLLASSLVSFLQIVASILVVVAGWQMKFTIVARASQVQGYAVGKLRRGRPTMRAPVRRKA